VGWYGVVRLVATPLEVRYSFNSQDLKEPKRLLGHYGRKTLANQTNRIGVFTHSKTNVCCHVSTWEDKREPAVFANHDQYVIVTAFDRSFVIDAYSLPRWNSFHEFHIFWRIWALFRCMNGILSMPVLLLQLKKVSCGT